MKPGYIPIAAALLLTAVVTGIVGGQIAVSHRGNGIRVSAVASNDFAFQQPSAEEKAEFEKLLESNPPANLSAPKRSRPRWSEQCGSFTCDAQLREKVQAVAFDAPAAEDDKPVAADKPKAISGEADLDGPQLRPDGVPDQMPHPEDASPIDENQQQTDKQTREIIAQELPAASPAEREIWFEELKGLQPQMIRELLRLRHLISPESTEVHPSMPQFPPQTAEPVSVPTMTNPGNPGSQSLSPTITSQSTIPSLDSSIVATRTARDVVLNNIANAQTPGFQRSRVLFEDLGYRQIKIPGQQDINGHASATDFSVGYGVQVAGIERDMTSGTLEASKSDLHLAIVGSGFFQVQDGTEILYTRAGTFTLNSSGEMVLASSRRSRLLEPPTVIPSDATNIEISDVGIVSVRQPGSSNLVTVGQVQIARFVNVAGLEPRGENLFAATDASGAAQVGSAGLAGCGKVRQRYLEASNVSVDDELAELQRLQSRIVALEKARAVLSTTAEPATVSPSRIAESIVR